MNIRKFEPIFRCFGALVYQRPPVLCDVLSMIREQKLEREPKSL